MDQMLSESNLYWMFLIAVGTLSGFGSGLLGIGGGLLVVPALAFALPFLDVTGPDMPKVAIATSLALIVPTSIASAQAHAARGAIDWRMLSLLSPCVVVGAFLAAKLVPWINTNALVLFFVIFAVVLAWRYLKAEGTPATATGAAPRGFYAVLTPLKGIAGSALAVSLGIGGAFFIIPIISRITSMQRAIGTASALALPLAIAGSAGYIMAATPEGCVQGCIGYIFFPAVAAIGISAVLAVPCGAWLAHRAPVSVLRRLFALFLIFAAVGMSYKTFSPVLKVYETKRIMAVIDDRSAKTWLRIIGNQERFLSTVKTRVSDAVKN